MYILAEALPSFICVHAASTHAIQTQVSLEKFNRMVYLDPIMHQPAGNEQLVFHTFVLAPDTD